MQQKFDHAAGLIRMTVKLYLELATSALTLVPGRR